MNIDLLGVERTEGRTDISKLIVAIHNFTKAPKKRLKVKSMLAFRWDISVMYDFRPWLHYLHCVRDITLTGLT